MLICSDDVYYVCILQLPIADCQLKQCCLSTFCKTLPFIYLVHS